MDTYKALEEEALRASRKEDLSHEQLAIIDLLHLTKMVNKRIITLAEVILSAKDEIVTLQALTRSLVQTVERVVNHRGLKLKDQRPQKRLK